MGVPPLMETVMYIFLDTVCTFTCRPNIIELHDVLWVQNKVERCLSGEQNCDHRPTPQEKITNISCGPGRPPKSSRETNAHVVAQISPIEHLDERCPCHDGATSENSGGGGSSLQMNCTQCFCKGRLHILQGPCSKSTDRES